MYFIFFFVLVLLLRTIIIQTTKQSCYLHKFFFFFYISLTFVLFRKKLYKYYKQNSWEFSKHSTTNAFKEIAIIFLVSKKTNVVLKFSAKFIILCLIYNRRWVLAINQGLIGGY